ncbi:Undecaprenyl-phosphate alpha-N-acetylglucosaminyl 1-phosphate transferase [Paraburkholderia metrosideri]|uniref:Undecaprenyl-phosphate alpha-N-acetylglucosaminyl 1-phosphate transferase n=1 Tax=Paraburkholderia metrosideri TaxID=580937 RepID=A0ABM8NGN7_9BURK|nr:Undecaprenyl-phosphate alpha-N-acetylglucosaminyl 1-phosphate transferase [Paraburkholderia metrosideri]
MTYLSTLPLWATIVLTALGAACACAAILWALLKTGIAWRLAVDVPNQRSMHVVPTPRIGGWGIVPVVVAAILLIAPSLWGVAVGAGFLAAISQIDDRRGLPVRVRFVAHIVAVVGLVTLFPAAAPWWELAILAFLMIWLVNLYNFMDGADGLAGGMALFGFAGYAVGALIAERPMIELALSAVAISSAAFGFLLFNFHPARIFLGDAGSISLGFLAGALGYWGWREGAWPVWFPILVFAPFIGDASVTLARRLLRGEKIWQAHREHYYQRMVRSGAGHAKAALTWYVVIAAGIMIAIYALGCTATVQACVVVVWIVVLCGAGAAVDLRWRRFQSTLSDN